MFISVFLLVLKISALFATGATCSAAAVSGNKLISISAKYLSLQNIHDSKISIAAKYLSLQNIHDDKISI